MIELVIKDFFDKHLSVPSFFEHEVNMPERCLLMERVGGKKQDGLKSSIFAFQSYAGSLYEAAKLNEEVKEVAERLVECDDISGVHLDSDYNFTDTETKRYRYQAVFSINHY